MRKNIVVCIIALIMILGISGCAKDNSMKDGFYSVEMSEFSHGWKEFVTIRVSAGKVVAVEYNAKNSTGFIKAWDGEYMHNMISLAGTYPNKYTREYSSKFLKAQDTGYIDSVSGATSSGTNFHKMASALIEKAKAGDTNIGIVE